MKERVLELGIGYGGKYLLEEAQGRVWVGVDKDNCALKEFPERYEGKTQLLLADADFPLPFENGSFDRIQLLFPNDELYYGLCSETHPLWPELHRVLNDQGEVDIVFDTTFLFVLPKVRGWLIPVFFPRRKIVTVGRKAGFHLEIRELTREEVQSIGTAVSKEVARSMGSFFFERVYRLSARKK